jgi:radical SAM superfamily enzyme YgiQ (UPF0313 family)
MAGFRGNIQIADDNFVGNFRKAMERMSAMIAWQNKYGYPFSFTAEGPVTVADHEDVLQKMADLRLKNLFLGIETDNEDALRECGKLQNIGRNLEADAEKIQSFGIETMSGFMVGFDADRADTFASRMINLIRNTGVVRAMVSIVQPQRGTELYDRLQREGRLLNEISGDNADGCVNFIPKMPIQTLRQGFEEIVRTIYTPEELYKRICKLLARYNVPATREKMNRENVLAFARSVWHIGLKGGWKTSLYYWKTMLTALFKYRRAFAEAVILQIFGMHFQQEAEKVIRGC